MPRKFRTSSRCNTLDWTQLISSGATTLMNVTHLAKRRVWPSVQARIALTSYSHPAANSRVYFVPYIAIAPSSFGRTGTLTSAALIFFFPRVACRRLILARAELAGLKNGLSTASRNPQRINSSLHCHCLWSLRTCKLPPKNVSSDVSKISSASQSRAIVRLPRVDWD